MQVKYWWFLPKFKKKWKYKHVFSQCTEAVTWFSCFLNYTIISVITPFLSSTFALSSPSCLAVCVGETRAIRCSFFLFVALSPESLQPISSDGSASRRRACKKDLRLCEPNPPAHLILAPPPIPTPFPSLPPLSILSPLPSLRALATV